MKIPAGIRRHLLRRRVYLQVIAIVVEFLRRLFSTLRLRQLDLNLTYGDGDPARTGMVKGISEALAGLARSRSKAVRIHLSPRFGSKELTADAEIEIRLRPVTVLSAMIRTGISALRKPALRQFVLQYTKKLILDLFHDDSAKDMEGR